MKNIIVGTGIIFFLVLLLLMPLMTITALNTLFSLNIAYTPWTYLSMIWLNMSTFGAVVIAIDKLKK